MPEKKNTIAYLFLFALVAGFITFAVLLGQKDNKTSFDFTIVSTSGTITKNGENDYSLVISHNDGLGDKRMMVFSDRPERKAYYITDSDISQLWSTNKTFGEDPPNAVVAINGFQQPVILKSFQYSEATDTTTFKLAADDIPIEEVTNAGPCQIFIDSKKSFRRHVRHIKHRHGKPNLCKLVVNASCEPISSPSSGYKSLKEKLRLVCCQN